MDNAFIKYYKPSCLEKCVSNLLQNNNILYPEDLFKEDFSKVFDIELFYTRASFFYEKNGYQAIMIKNSIDSKQQNFEYYHEFGHLYCRHNGNQLSSIHHGLMPSNQLSQENEALRFAYYTAIPVHMFKFIDFEDENLVEIVSDQFLIPEKNVNVRLFEIYRNIKDNINDRSQDSLRSFG